MHGLLYVALRLSACVLVVGILSEGYIITPGGGKKIYLSECHHLLN